MRSLLQLSNSAFSSSSTSASLAQVSFSPDLDVTLGCYEKTVGNSVEFEIRAWQSNSLSNKVASISLQAANTDKSQLISLSYLPDAQAVCVLARSGDIGLIRLDDFSIDDDVEYPTEIVGTVEPGIVAASYSPDEELLVIVTLNDDLLLMTANGQFDVLAELPLRSSDFGQDKNVNVGWGSKQTQFHGRAGKQAATLPGGPSLVADNNIDTQSHSQSEPVGLADDDGQVRVTWRGDSAFFAVSTLDLLDKESGDGQVKARVIRTYSRASAELQSTSEFAPGLSHPLAWRKGAGAPVIASLMRYGQTTGCAEGYDHLDVVFFERNGLRHGEFTLKGIAQTALLEKRAITVKELEWSCDGAVLAVHLQVDNEDVIQLYSTGNWHWYLKTEIYATKLFDRRVQGIKFSDETSLHLSIILPDSYQTIEWAWTVYSSPNEQHDLGLVVVVDGHETKCTPLGVANVPPPMSLYQVKSGGTPLQIAFTHAKFALLLPLGEVQVYGYDHTKPHSKPELVSTHRVPVHARQLAWMGEHALAVLTSGELAILDLEAHSYTKADIGEHVATALQHSLIVSGAHDTALLEDKEAQLFTFTAEAELSPLDLALDEFCPHVQYHGATESVVAMTSNGKLKLGELEGVMMTTLTNNALSFTLTPEFLIGTTSAHKAIFLDMHAEKKEVEEVEERRVERGSRIVLACPRAMRLILQMPRGNLETIAPRPLVLQNVKRDVDAANYRNAFIACRKHRIDMNIIFDHNPSLFFEKLNAFVDQIPEIDHLNLFLTGLRNEDLTLTQYAKRRDDSVDAAKPTKVNEICSAVRKELEGRDLVQYTQTIMTSYVRMTPPDVEAALNLLHKLKDVNSDLAEEGVKYIIFLVDSRTLFDHALGMYDFELVLMVAQHSQRDPKEYLPFLRNLQGMEIELQRFHIDDHLSRHGKALGHIYKSEGQLEMFITYTQDHELYKEALELSKSNSDTHKIVLEVYGDYLMSENLYRDAGLAYRLAHLTEKAMEAYDRAHAWQELFALMAVEGVSASEMEDTAYRIAEDLNQRRRFSEAGRVLSDYTSDVRAAADQYIKGGDFAEAIRTCIFKGQTTLIDSFIKPSLLNSQETVMDEVEEMGDQLTKQMERLHDLRKAKQAQPEAYYLEESLENNPALDNVDVSSEATTAVTQFTRYTQRASTFASSAMTGASKKNSKKSRRKAAMKEASGKRGTVNEEVYILASLKRLVERVHGTLREAGRLLDYLLLYAYDEEHGALTEKLGSLEKRIEDAIIETWKEDEGSIIDRVPEEEKGVWERVENELSRKYKLPAKPASEKINWRSL